jgi:uncharacterized membrane protein YkvA (DUF1232 family)
MSASTRCAAARQLPVVTEWHERVVRERFWKKLLRVIGRIPFAEDLAAAYFCLVDPDTPPSVRALVLAILAYFVLQFEFVRAIARAFGLVGDAAVLAVGLSVIADHIKPHHRQLARLALGLKHV